MLDVKIKMQILYIETFAETKLFRQMCTISSKNIRIIFSYDDFYEVFFYVCGLQSYDAFFFYRKA